MEAGEQAIVVEALLSRVCGLLVGHVGCGAQLLALVIWLVSTLLPWWARWDGRLGFALVVLVVFSAVAAIVRVFYSLSLYISVLFFSAAGILHVLFVVFFVFISLVLVVGVLSS